MPTNFPRSAVAVEKMCKVLNVSSSGYYYWRKHPVGARQQKQNQLVSHIRQVHTQSQCRYGSPRIADELRDQGVKASRNRIARLMKKVGIRSIMYKKYRVQTTESNHDYPVAKNLLNREFTADKPGQKWVSDITARAAPLYCHWSGVVVPDSDFGPGRPKSGWVGLERESQSGGYECGCLAHGPQKQTIKWPAYPPSGSGRAVVTAFNMPALNLGMN